MKVVFMGSSDFALPAFLQLLEHKEFDVISVYTKKPKPAGRGLSIKKTPIHTLAEERVKSLIQTPLTLKDHYQLPECDVIVVVAYGLILPKHVIEHPKIATINIHPSLLPRWRGAAPIQHAFLSGDTQTGVSIIEVTQKLDTGDIFLQEKTHIKKQETYKELHDRLSAIGAKMLIETLCNIYKIKPKPQSEFGITYADKLPNSVKLDCKQSIETILKQIDVFSGILTTIFDINIKILKADFDIQKNNTDQIGQIIKERNSLKIFCSDGILLPTLLQPQGKKPMDVKSFLNGLRCS